ncbi:MAG TPA: hypothetical protein PLT65_05235 [Bacilli bacterium]|nr:hypothetical protein [Bacilli bacterium]
MKKTLMFIVIILISVTGCKTKGLLYFQDIQEIKYINENKDNISSVVVHKTTLASNDCYKVDIDEAYEKINKIKIIKKSNIFVTDDYLSYNFKFDDETKKTVYFEGKYLVIDKESYTIENFPQIELKEENIIECQY